MRILETYYAASRLYLIYHNEIPAAEFVNILRYWKEACEGNIEIVPTFVLVSYNREQDQVFTNQEIKQLCAALRNLGFTEIAVYDVLPNREQGSNLSLLAQEFPPGLIRVGIQPEEEVTPPFRKAVQDTWAAICHGKTNSDWQRPGFGARHYTNG